MAKVSVIVTHYNNNQWLPEALDSIFAQTLRPFEVIIVDDGSHIRPSLVAKEPDLVTVVYAPHRGLGAVLNTAVALMRGDVLTWLPADDTWIPEKLARQSEFAAQHPFCVCHSFAYLRHEANGVTTEGTVPNYTDAEFSAAIRASSPYFGNTFWFPRQVLATVGPFREDVPACEEYEWVLKSVVKCGIRYRLQEEFLTTKRITGDSTAQRCAADIPGLVRQFNEELDHG